MKFTRKESRAPLIHDNLVIALIGSLKAFDSKTGKLVWENMDVRENPAPQSPGKAQTENSSFATLVRLFAQSTPQPEKLFGKDPVEEVPHPWFKMIILSYTANKKKRV